MHDRFEKEVQKKMEELELRPSAPVWEKIEIEITPEKKKRRVIVWFFFGLLFLSTGFFAYRFLQNNSTTTAVQPVPDVSAPATPTFDSLQEKKDIPSERPVTTIPNDVELENIPAGKRIVTARKSNTRIFIDHQKREEVKKPVPAGENIVTVDQPKNKVPSDAENSPLVDKNPVKGNVQIEKEKFSPIEQGNATKDSTVATVVPIKQDSVIKTEPEKVKVSQPVIDSSAKKKVAINSKWKKRIDFSIGKSGYTTASLSKSAVNDAGYQSPGPSPIVSGNALGRQAKTDPGLSFSVGLSFAKNLTEHLELAIGAQYSYYSTRTNVGSQRRGDTIVFYNSASSTTDRFYTNSGNDIYTNQFHAVELPVTISYRPALKLPLYISVGAAYGRILSTNALTYSPNSNVYYENKENYLRNTLPVFSSIQVELFAKKKVSLRIGPALQYNLLKVQKEVSSGASHLFFAGIKGGIIF